MYVATLVGNSKKRNLTPEIVAEVKAACRGAIRVEYLSEDVAVDIFCDEILIKKPPQAIDLIIQKAANRKKKLLVCDMESTIIDNEFLDEIADIVGIKDKVAEITERAMNGELNFEAALEERVKLVAGLPESEIRALIQSRLIYNQGAKELLAACRRNNVYTMLVSGGFTIFTDHVSRELGFDESHANTLLFNDKKLSGVGRPILGKEAKLEFLKKKSIELGIGLNETAAIGDGANDLPMLHAAGLGMAYKAKPKVKEEIKNQINNSDLMALAYAIGIK